MNEGLSVAEIKSTLELAMERTKKITISKEERDEIKQKESLQKVNGLFHRYREGLLSLNEILREIERMDQKTRTMTKEILLSQWIDALSLNEEDEKLLEGIEALKGQEMDEVRAKLHHLLSQYQREKDRVKEEVTGRSTEALRKDGISGSAVEPKIEGSKLWKKEMEKLDRSYQIKLDEIKEQLRRL
jgi:ElaB/YqjD/DUF883 family membrane-anchored ribosome-binding protein